MRSVPWSEEEVDKQLLALHVYVLTKGLSVGASPSLASFYR